MAKIIDNGAMREYMEQNGLEYAEPVAGIIRPKVRFRFRVSHFERPIDFVVPHLEQLSVHSNIISNQTVKCTTITKNYSGSFTLILEDDISNRVLDYIRTVHNLNNYFLVEMLDGDATTISSTYLENCRINSISNELDYGHNSAHDYTLLFDVGNVRHIY